jgi:hypothetical protein
MHAQGEVLREKLVLPRLKVRKGWWEGLGEQPIDTSHPDIGSRPDAQDGSIPQPGIVLSCSALHISPISKDCRHCHVVLAA